MSGSLNARRNNVIVIEAPLRLEGKAYVVKRLFESLGYSVEVEINPGAGHLKVIFDGKVLYDYNYAYLLLLKQARHQQG